MHYGMGMQADRQRACLDFCQRYLAEPLQQAVVVESGDPLQRSWLDSLPLRLNVHSSGSETPTTVHLVEHVHVLVLSSVRVDKQYHRRHPARRPPCHAYVISKKSVPPLFSLNSSRQ